MAHWQDEGNAHNLVGPAPRITNPRVVLVQFYRDDLSIRLSSGRIEGKLLTMNIVSATAPANLQRIPLFLLTWSHSRSRGCHSLQSSAGLGLARCRCYRHFGAKSRSGRNGGLFRNSPPTNWKADGLRSGAQPVLSWHGAYLLRLSMILFASSKTASSAAWRLGICPTAESPEVSVHRFKFRACLYEIAPLVGLPVDGANRPEVKLSTVAGDGYAMA